MSDTLSIDEIRRVARLARLALDDDEVRRFAAQLGDVLAHVAAIQSVDTADVPATAHIAGAQAPREDAILPSLPRDEVLAAAPAADLAAGLFKVPRVLGS